MTEHRTAYPLTSEPGGTAFSPYPFEIVGEAGQPPRPVLLSVPHAGRDYPAVVLARARVSTEALRRLEDRYADLLLSGVLASGYSAVVARIARAVIDLNRDPRDIDPRGVTDMPRQQPLIQSAKQRGGLGLFPRSLPRTGDLWHAPMTWDEASGYIRSIHEPYHKAITAQLDLVQEYYGQALLVDLHSMPPLVASGGVARPDVVIGDRFGASASSRFAELARAVVARHGLIGVVNHPYPGSYVIERHGRPGLGRHALQIEIARDLYLDAALDRPASRLSEMCAMIVDLIRAFGEEIGGGLAIAAE